MGKKGLLGGSGGFEEADDFGGSRFIAAVRCVAGCRMPFLISDVRIGVILE